MKRIFKSLFAFMFMLSCGLVLAACGTQDFDGSKIKIGETNFTYDGYTHVCEIDYEVADVQVSVTYSETLDGQFKPAEELSFINAGTYSVYYKLSAIGFNDYVSAESVAFTVAPKEVALNISDVEIVKSNMGDTAPTITPTYTAPGVISGDNLGLSFGIGAKVGSVGTPFNATTAVAGDEYYITATNTNGNYKVTYADSKVKIIDTVEYINASGATVYSSDLSTAALLAKTGTTLKLHSDVELLDWFDVKDGKELTLDLNGYTVSAAQVERNCVILIRTASKLTIKDSVGTGVVNVASRTNDQLIAIWAYAGGEVVIDGGTFTNVGSKDFQDDGVTPNNNELIYASGNGSSVVINGGTFIGNYENATWGTRYALNLRDGDNSTITVKGGKFFEYNPAESASENPVANFVATGFTSTETVVDGQTWFVVTANQA